MVVLTEGVLRAVREELAFADVVCDAGEFACECLVPGLQKVAGFYEPDGRPFHAAGVAAVEDAGHVVALVVVDYEGVGRWGSESGVFRFPNYVVVLVVQGGSPFC